MRSLGIIHGSRLCFTLSFVLLTGGCASTPTQSIPDTCPSVIKNFCVVSPGVLWRGASPDKEGAAWLIKQGVRTIVNLELLHDDLPAFTQANVGNAARYEVGYFRIPDWEPFALFQSVEDDHVAHFLAIVNQQPKPVYVHCRSGQNRTGLMVAAYRVIVEGENSEQAISEMERYDGLWFEFDAKYIRGLSPQRREEIRLKAMQWIPKLKTNARIVCEKGTCAISDH